MEANLQGLRMKFSYRQAPQLPVEQ